MNIFKKIKSSIYNPEFYENTVKTERLRDGIKYFYKFALVFGLVASVIGLIASPFYIKQARVLLNKVASEYPKELEVVIANGEASTNAPEPYIVPAPKEMTAEDETIKNIFVIDTKNQFTLERFKEYSTFALLSKNSLIAKSSKDQIRVQELKSLPDMTINQASVLSFKDKIVSKLPYLPILIVVGIFLGVLIIATNNLIYLLLGACFIWLLMKLKKVPCDYKRAYIIGIHAMTLPAIISVGFFAVSFSAPLFFTILMLVMVWFNVKDVSQSQITTLPIEKEKPEEN